MRRLASAFRPSLRLLLVLGVSILLAGCAGSGRNWPRSARGYIDANQDGVRQINEYVDPTYEFGPDDTVLLVNNVHTDRRGKKLRLVVWAPDRQTVIARYSTTMHEKQPVITHYRTTAREWVEQGGYGRYLVNWRIEKDTIEAYEIEIRPSDPAIDELLDFQADPMGAASRPEPPTLPEGT
ncbi:MAG: hypothetical protein GY715_14760 [Planctomycetes bacterium]|nr:hypothetical protein [Planctomycetota bacterium]